MAMLDLKRVQVAVLAMGFLIATPSLAVVTASLSTKTGAVTYAKEVVGPAGSGEVLGWPVPASGDLNRPYVDIDFHDPDYRVGTNTPDCIDAGESAEIKYILSGGAAFDNRVRSDNLYGVEQDDDVVNRVELTTRRIIDGGQVGDRFVTFEIVLGECFTATDASDVTFIRFEPPELRGAVGKVEVQVEMESTSSIGTPFPSFPPRNAPTTVVRSVTIVNAPKSAVTLAVDNVGSDSGALSVASIRVDSTRTKLVASGNPNVTIDRDGAFNFVVAELNVGVSDQYLDASGDVFSPSARDNAGRVLVNVTGDFRAGDKVSVGERPLVVPLVVSVAAGTATGSMPLASTSAMNVRYTPNDVDALRPGDIKTTASVDFTRLAADFDAEKPATGRLVYEGASAAAAAYAIAPPTNPDRSNVRVKCESAADCAVYFACDDQDGNDLFVSAGSVDGRNTEVWDTMDMAEFLEGEPWADGDTGRLSCRVFGTSGTVSVQVLTRSGGVLVNNTYVEGLP